MVRLRQMGKEAVWDRFITVSIPLWCDCDRLGAGPGHCSRPFQSHYGAIATRHRQKCPGQSFVSIPLWCDCDQHWCLGMGHMVISFNPTMVRLRRNNLVPIYYRLLRFNPTMVRLRRRGTMYVHIRLKTFQSHYGAIATHLLFPEQATSLNCFNPTMVRLRRLRFGPAW